MKVVHFCPIYIDNWGYQDNLLPRYFHEFGCKVYVITPTKLPKYISKSDVGYERKYNIDGVEIRRIKVLFYLSHTLFLTVGLYKHLKELKPNILFHHGIGFSSVFVCALYRLFHPSCSFFIDNHTDEINQSKSKIWVNLYSKLFLRFLIRIISPLVIVFYGVSHSRCDYLEKVFKIKRNKIKLLPIGADTISAEITNYNNIDVRDMYKIPSNKYLVISGGKMGINKGTDVLINAVLNLNTKGENLTLVLFGLIEDDSLINIIKENDCIINIQWCNRVETLSLLSIADVAVWPIHHTTLIEDSIACLTPIIIRKTGTTQHLIDGNGLFVESGSLEEIEKSIKEIKALSESSDLKSKCLKMRDLIDYRSIVNLVIKDYKSELNGK